MTAYELLDAAADLLEHAGLEAKLAEKVRRAKRHVVDCDVTGFPAKQSKFTGWACKGCEILLSATDDKCPICKDLKPEKS